MKYHLLTDGDTGYVVADFDTCWADPSWVVLTSHEVLVQDNPFMCYANILEAARQTAVQYFKKWALDNNFAHLNI